MTQKKDFFMKMQKKQFRIGALAQELDLEKFVIRFWEKEFNIRSSRSSGGQRYYTSTDLATFKHIKKLLYDQKFTIAGAKAALNTHSNKVVGSHKTIIHTSDTLQISKAQLTLLREALVSLRNQL